ncbi:MAG: ATP-binding protein [Pirellulales bacterium]|nr:ATP-binding protein [Pirellulales bacterium]
MADAVVEIPIPGQQSLLLAGDRERKSSALPEHHFLAGPENQLADSVVRSILEGSPRNCNPVTFYGPSGSGKSHLALGIAAAWKEKHRRQRVECTSAAEFSRELAEAVEAQGLEEFREKYREAALVVIEDFHRLGRKGSVSFSQTTLRNASGRPGDLNAQEELIHTLDALTRRGSWILLTTLAAPGECPGILPMLQSRLSEGLVVPLVLPGFTTRLELIRQQSSVLKCKLPKSAAESLARRLQGTVPEIRRAVARLDPSSVHNGKKINTKIAKQLFGDREPADGPSFQKIASLAARHFGLKTTLLRGPSRKRNIVNARDLAIYLSRQLSSASLGKIGRYFGGRDHTTVMHSCRKIEALIKTNSAYRRELELLIKQANRSP